MGRVAGDGRAGTQGSTKQAESAQGKARQSKGKEMPGQARQATPADFMQETGSFKSAFREEAD
jgi:hypothetical protein